MTFHDFSRLLQNETKDPVSRAMNLNPGVGVRLVFTQLVSYLRVKYLRSTPGHAAKSRLFEVFQYPADRFLGLELEPIDLDRRPTLQVNLGVVLGHQFDDVTIPFVGFLVM